MGTGRTIRNPESRIQSKTGSNRRQWLVNPTAKNLCISLKSASQPSGFTLVELLAVISMIAILLVVAVVSLRGLGGASKMSAAANEVKLVLDGARQYARTYNTEVLVGIVATNSTGLSTNNILKTIVAYYPQKNDSGTITNWVPTGNPYNLPDGIFFDTENRSPIVIGENSTNYASVAGGTNLSIAGGVQAELMLMQFAADGSLTNAPGSAFDPYSNAENVDKIYIPLIPAQRFITNSLQGANLQTNLAAIIEISGQTGISVIKRVE